ncbi:MAG: hypothetical protein Ta2C_11000 [Candidatus Endomicrobiellum trichonymphae]|uniref:hypothetical protein n=1 Tax=Endomicrobium trichonymphae TaxID=1408204 RepID=UPI0027D44A3D|nr:MAG: hypothetical protein Ta2C_11000 [Candidatus Endomicrobium trichonymphae]
MLYDELSVLKQIKDAFPKLSQAECETAVLLLKEFASNQNITFDEYVQKNYPNGIAERDESTNQYCGYIKFLGNDAAAIIKAGADADFSTFFHETVHSFRKQLTGDLKTKAERAFNVDGSKWTVEQEEAFALGAEQFIMTRIERDADKREVFVKCSNYVQGVYNGLGDIIELTPEMEAFYEDMFFEKNPVAEEPVELTEDEKRFANVVKIDPSVITNENDEPIDLTDTRELTKWLLDTYVPKNENGQRIGIELEIADDGTIQKFSRTGLEASTKRRNSVKSESQRQAYAKLDTLLKESLFDEFIKADKRHPRLLGQNVYYSAAEINEKIYSVKFKVDIPRENKKASYKDHKVSEIEIAPSLYAGLSTSNARSVSYQNQDAITKISLAVLKESVKPSKIENGILLTR